MVVVFFSIYSLKTRLNSLVFSRLQMKRRMSWVLKKFFRSRLLLTTRRTQFKFWLLHHMDSQPELLKRYLQSKSEKGSIMSCSLFSLVENSDSTNILLLPAQPLFKTFPEADHVRRSAFSLKNATTAVDVLPLFSLLFYIYSQNLCVSQIDKEHDPCCESLE